MILKWLVTGFMVFSIYKFFIKRKMVSPPPQQANFPPMQENTQGDFIDYEEVE